MEQFPVWKGVVEEPWLRWHLSKESIFPHDFDAIAHLFANHTKGTSSSDVHLRNRKVTASCRSPAELGAEGGASVS